MIRSTLVLRYRGWSTIRLATEPDPPDEPRGASGYTFAFASEPPLDRVIRTQPADEPSLLRAGAPWEWGVYVYDAFVAGSDGNVAPCHELVGTRFVLHGAPKFESRNWLLTPPGFEPIVPFDLAIETAPSVAVIRRSAPLDPANPARPVWAQPPQRLLDQGAKDLYPERETVGSATGIWDSLGVVEARIARLQELRNQETDPERLHCLEARLRDLRFAIANPQDRRVMVRPFVERFAVVMNGADAQVPSEGRFATLNTAVPWFADFWMGGFDWDLLAAFINGSLQVPFRGQ